MARLSQVGWLNEVARAVCPGCGPIPHGAGPGSDECLDQPVGRGLRHDGDCHPGGHHVLRPDHGRPDDHRRKAGRPVGTEARLLDRSPHLRVRVRVDRRQPDRRTIVARLVDSRRNRGCAGPPGTGRFDRRELPGHRPGHRLWSHRRRGRCRNRRWSDPRRLGDHQLHLAICLCG